MLALRGSWSAEYAQSLARLRTLSLWHDAVDADDLVRLLDNPFPALRELELRARGPQALDALAPLLENLPLEALEVSGDDTAIGPLVEKLKAGRHAALLS